jgi:hypothetical protein
LEGGRGGSVKAINKHHSQLKQKAFKLMLLMYSAHLLNKKMSYLILSQFDIGKTNAPTFS